MNSIIAAKLGDDANEYRELYMDNRYSAPELFVMLKLKYIILVCHTIRTNHERWNCIMHLKKKGEQEECLTKYDPVNKILFGQ